MRDFTLWLEDSEQKVNNVYIYKQTCIKKSKCIKFFLTSKDRDDG